MWVQAKTMKNNNIIIPSHDDHTSSQKMKKQPQFTTIPPAYPTAPITLSNNENLKDNFLPLPKEHAITSEFKKQLEGTDSIKLNHLSEKGTETSDNLIETIHFSDEIETNNSTTHMSTHSVERKEKIQTRIHRSKTKSNTCTMLVLFVVTYLLGCSIAGVLHCFLSGNEQLYLDFYLQNILRTLNGEQFCSLFLNNFSFSIVSLTVVLLLGLSAFGVPLLFAFLLLKGIGSGLLFLQLFLEYQWNGVLYYCATIGISEFFLSVCCCILSLAVAKSAANIFKYTFSNHKLTTQPRRFMRCIAQYLILLLFMFVISIVLAVLTPNFFSFSV